MSTYRSPYKTTRRRVNFKLIAALFALIGAISTISLTSISFSKSKKITNAKKQIETIKIETANIEKELPTLEKGVKDLSAEAESLKNILWRYEPVIIPESMK